MQAPDTRVWAQEPTQDEWLSWADEPSKDGVTPAVWLTPHACLMRSHLNQPDDEHTVIHVVGTSHCEDLAGWVLMLG